MTLPRARGALRVLPAVAAVIALMLCSGAGPNIPGPRARSMLVVRSSVPFVPVGTRADHGRAPAHRPMQLPGHGPYGVRSDARYLPVYGSPNDTEPNDNIDTHNPLDQQFRLPVQTVRRNPDGSGWLRVLLPDEAEGKSAWVSSDDVRVVTLRERLVVDLSAFTLRHYRDGKLVDTFRVGVGRPEFPTPTGTYFIWAQVPQGMPNGPYGVFALGTSAFSAVIDDGRVGVHGTADPNDRGHRVSHGCIRVYNTEMLKLEHVPLGTPLIIHL
jgi:lipoprotein-anchoring transpeptidase ErfK/SrfK